MPRIRIPSLLQPLAGGAAAVDVDGSTLRAVIDDLVRRHPALDGRIFEAGEIRQDVMIAIDSDETRDLDAPVPVGAEVHILPAIAGGA